MSKIVKTIDVIEKNWEKFEDISSRTFVSMLKRAFKQYSEECNNEIKINISMRYCDEPGVYKADFIVTSNTQEAYEKWIKTGATERVIAAQFNTPLIKENGNSIFYLVLDNFHYILSEKSPSIEEFHNTVAICILAEPAKKKSSVQFDDIIIKDESNMAVYTINMKWKVWPDEFVV